MLKEEKITTEQRKKERKNKKEELKHTFNLCYQLLETLPENTQQLLLGNKIEPCEKLTKYNLPNNISLGCKSEMLKQYALHQLNKHLYPLPTQVSQQWFDSLINTLSMEWAEYLYKKNKVKQKPSAHFKLYCDLLKLLPETERLKQLQTKALAGTGPSLKDLLLRQEKEVLEKLEKLKTTQNMPENQFISYCNSASACFLRCYLDVIETFPKEKWPEMLEGRLQKPIVTTIHLQSIIHNLIASLATHPKVHQVTDYSLVKFYFQLLAVSPANTRSAYLNNKNKQNHALGYYMIKQYNTNKNDTNYVNLFKRYLNLIAPEEKHEKATDKKFSKKL